MDEAGTKRVEASVAVGLGSNLGRRRKELGAALVALDRRYGVAEASPVYASPARGPGVTGEFLNLCALLRWAPPPGQLLEELLELEARSGRPRCGPGRGGNRRLDLDLLVYGERRIRRPGLVVPHPRLADRPFVLLPLRDLDPGLAVPGTGRTVAELAREVDGEGLRRVGSGRELMARARAERGADGAPKGAIG